MKTIGITSTCALALLLAIAAPVWAQEQHEQEQKQKPAMQEQKQAKPEKAAKQEEKPAAKSEKPAKQEEKQVKPEKAAKQEEKPAKQEEKPAKENEKSAKAEEKNTQPAKESKGEKKNDMRPGGQVNQGKQGMQARGGRIPDDRYKAKFGERHTFHVNQNDYTRNHRFKYGGYSFGFVGVWPSDWLYTQDVYVIEIDGVYYLCNPMYPGVNIEITVIV